MDANYYGLMAGERKTFDTESTITRAMWVTMLYKMAGQPAVQSKGHLHRREDGRLVCPGGHLGGGGSRRATRTEAV